MQRFSPATLPDAATAASGAGNAPATLPDATTAASGGTQITLQGAAAATSWGHATLQQRSQKRHFNSAR